MKMKAGPVLFSASFASFLELLAAVEFSSTHTSSASGAAILHLGRLYAMADAHPRSKPESVPTYDNSSLENLRPDKAPWLCTSRERLGPFELADLAGRKWTDRELKGKVVIAVVWTTWCGFCIQELSAMQELYDNTRQDDQIVLVTLNVDDDPARVAPFAKKRGYAFPVFLARSIFKEVPDGVPINWLVDREGVIRKEVCGYGRGWLELLLKDALALKEGAPLTPGFEKLTPGHREENEPGRHGEREMELLASE